MSTTKYKISEQVMVMLEGGDPAIASKTDIRDIMELVGQTINSLLKAEYYGPHIQAGEVSAAGLMLATYEDISVEAAGDFARLKLPCMPVKLLKNQGLYEISKPDDLIGRYQFIPVPAGMFALLGGISITSDVLGQICYVNEGLDVIFARNIFKTDDITKVRVKLVVADVGRLGEYDPLPIHAEMELPVVTTVYQILANPKPANNIVDIGGGEPRINGLPPSAGGRR